MPFPFICPHCGNFTQVADHLVGSSVPCLGCGNSVELRAPTPDTSAEAVNPDPAGLVFTNEPGAALPAGAQTSRSTGAKKRTKSLKRKLAIAGVLAHVVVISVGVWLLIWQSSRPADPGTTNPPTPQRTHPTIVQAPPEDKSKSRPNEEDAVIVLENVPDEAEILVDETVRLKNKGSKSIDLNVKAGKPHHLRVKKDGFNDFVQVVQKIAAGKRMSIVVDLKPTVPVVAAVSPGDPGFVPLFNVKDLPADWRLVDGILGHFGPPATRLLPTRRDDYKDFILRLEARLRKPGGKSYVIFRRSFQGLYHVHLDDKRNGQLCWAPQGDKGEILRGGTAQTLDVWMKLEIHAVGKRLRIIMDGESLSDFVEDKIGSETGEIGLLADNQSVEFRNIEIKVLATAPPARAAPKEVPGAGMVKPGEVARLNDRLGAGFPSRAGPGRTGLLRAGGGNKESEDAVARGLKWLAKQQNKNSDLLKNGYWESDGTSKSRVAGTGIALLAFLAAGYTDRSDRSGPDYHQTVADGVGYLTRTIKEEGSWSTASMYEHAIATMALCEFYGMTHEPKLNRYCKAATNFIVNAQLPAGGWRYGPGQAGDTFVTGWQIQALRSAHLAGFAVPNETIRKAMAFLDSVQAGQTIVGSAYGHTNTSDASPSTTAVGLLCRQYLGWDQKNPALVAGIQELKKQQPAENGESGVLDIDYLYYGTQVIHNYGGPDWQFWNPRVRNRLVKLQVGPGNAYNGGSWDPNPDPFDVTAKAGGRLFTTCFALLDLEVYYRYLPVYKNDNPKDTEKHEEPAKPTEVPKPPAPTEVPKETKPAVTDEKDAALKLDSALGLLAAAADYNSKNQYDNATKKYEKAIDGLRTLIAKYPESEQAKKAREELKNLTEQFEKIKKERPDTDGGKQATELLKKLSNPE